jgi:perosamine synthetase
MDPERVRDFLENGCVWAGGKLRNRITGRRVRAIVPVHILGHPVDMDPILKLANRYGLAVIEDATEALGARYKGKRVGHLGHIACFSFIGNKIITTGGGGMLVTDSEDWAVKARYLSMQAKDDPLEYVHNAIGYNYRLTNIQAAMGCAQMESLDEYVSAKRSIAEAYSCQLTTVAGLAPMQEATWAFSTFWMFTLLVDPEAYGDGSRKLLRRLQHLGVQTRPLWRPIHLSPAHSRRFTTPCPVAERLQRQALSLPCSVGLSRQDQAKVIRSLCK